MRTDEPITGRVRVANAFTRFAFRIHKEHLFKKKEKKVSYSSQLQTSSCPETFVIVVTLIQTSSLTTAAFSLTPSERTVVIASLGLVILKSFLPDVNQPKWCDNEDVLLMDFCLN